MLSVKIPEIVKAEFLVHCLFWTNKFVMAVTFDIYKNRLAYF